MITPFSPVQEQIEYFFGGNSHPYHDFEKLILDHIQPHFSVLDVGCGRTAPNLVKLVGRAKKLYGIDLVEFDHPGMDIVLTNHDVCNMSSISDGSIDLIYSRSVMEHVKNPSVAYGEIHRVLKPGGFYIFLTPSFYDYASIISHLVPNRFHPKIVAWTEGRQEDDVFPAYYKVNTWRAVKRLSKAAHFEIVSFSYLGQHPSYFNFSRTLFFIGSIYQKLISKFAILYPLQGWILCVLRK